MKSTLNAIILKKNRLPTEPGMYATAIFKDQIELVHVVSVEGTKKLFYHYGDNIKLNLHFFPNAWWSKKLTFEQM